MPIMVPNEQLKQILFSMAVLCHSPLLWSREMKEKERRQDSNGVTSAHRGVLFLLKGPLVAFHRGDEKLCGGCQVTGGLLHIRPGRQHVRSIDACIHPHLPILALHLCEGQTLEL